MRSLEQEASSSWSSPLAFGAALGLLAAVATTRPALAADLENGEAVFSGNCTACHAGTSEVTDPQEPTDCETTIKIMFALFRRVGCAG